jgi:hypothetical protein
MASTQRYGGILGPALLVLLLVSLAPAAADAEGRHDGSFSVTQATSGILYNNLSPDPQTVLLTVCLSPASQPALVSVGGTSFAVPAGNCRSASLVVAASAVATLVTSGPGTTSGTYQVTAEVRR